MDNTRQLFSEFKQCKSCSRPLPNMYHEDICPVCKEIQLFSDVKEYIRENTVNEYEVAEHFDIPIYKVKSWIREGRIQYNKGSVTSSAIGMHCQACGAPISFGTVCAKCLNKINGRSGYATSAVSDSVANRMRYVDN